MAETLTAQILSNINCTFTQTFPTPPTSASTTFSGTPASAFSRTLGTGEVSKLYYASLAITSAGTSIDLGNFVDAYGLTQAMSVVRSLFIWNQDTSNSMTVGGGTSAAFALLPFNLTGTSASAGRNGSCLQLTTKINITSTARYLALTATGGTVPVDVFVMGN